MSNPECVDTLYTDGGCKTINGIYYDYSDPVNGETLSINCGCEYLYMPYKNQVKIVSSDCDATPGSICIYNGNEDSIEYCKTVCNE